MGDGIAADFYRQIAHSLDPDVAEHLGAFQEDAIILADLIEDALLTINGQGEALYEER